MKKKPLSTELQVTPSTTLIGCDSECVGAGWLCVGKLLPVECNLTCKHLSFKAPTHTYIPGEMCVGVCDLCKAAILGVFAFVVVVVTVNNTCSHSLALSFASLSSFTFICHVAFAFVVVVVALSALLSIVILLYKRHQFGLVLLVSYLTASAD